MRTHKPKKEEKTMLIYGKHPVLDMLNKEPRRIEKLLIKDTLNKELLQQIKERASDERVAYSLVTQRTLDDIADGMTHQGLAAHVTPVGYLELEEWLEQVKEIENPCVVILDELEDPQNVGAIIRTAVAAGVHGIIIPKHRQAPLSGAAYKASAGLLERIPLVRVTNINDAIRTLKDNRYWTVGLDQKAKTNLWTQDLDMAVCFIVGSEGSGMREKTAELCDFTTRIPMDNGAESLNASVSAALVMYEWKRRRSVKK
jgi:23S rRNA (guanosine2251-2'-O)-methyltransferase